MSEKTEMVGLIICRKCFFSVKSQARKRISSVCGAFAVMREMCYFLKLLSEQHLGPYRDKLLFQENQEIVVTRYWKAVTVTNYLLIKLLLVRSNYSRRNTAGCTCNHVATKSSPHTIFPSGWIRNRWISRCFRACIQLPITQRMTDSTNSRTVGTDNGTNTLRMLLRHCAALCNQDDWQALWKLIVLVGSSLLLRHQAFKQYFRKKNKVHRSTRRTTWALRGETKQLFGRDDLVVQHERVIYPLTYESAAYEKQPPPL